MMTPASESQQTAAVQDATQFIYIGWLVLAVGLFGFLLWAAFAPLDKGVAAPGTVMVAGNRKTVQVPANGVITEIAVKEGDSVKAGSLLVRLNDVQARAQTNVLRTQYYTALATIARLQAERDAKAEVTFSEALLQQQNEPRIAEIVELQQQLFSSRRLTLRSEIEGYKQSIAGVRLQLEGAQGAQAGKYVQLASLREQEGNMKELADQGYLPRNRYLEVKRLRAEIHSSINENQGRIGQLQKQLLEIQQQIEQRQADYQREVSTQLALTSTEANEYRSKLESADVDLANTTITAPAAGTVVGLNVFTVGGVVNAGERLMEIVPREAELVVEARLGVELVDKVYQGLPVDLLFTAFNQNQTPKVPGTVTLVSADRLVDEFNGQPYYQMKVTVSPAGMEILKKRDIRPGMSVEVFVKTGTRSLLSYLFKPVLDRASTALSEE